MNRLLGFLKSPITLQTYGMIMGFVIALIAAPNQGVEQNRLDEWSNQAENHFVAKTLTFLSAQMDSPRAQIKLGKRYLIEGDSKGAESLFFKAAWKVPALGLNAGKLMLTYGTNDRDMALAADYLTRAALLSDNAEAFRLLGYLALGRDLQIACSSWKRAFHAFEQAAQHGDGLSQLITSYSYGLGLGVHKSKRSSLGFLLIAEQSSDHAIAQQAKKQLDTFAYLYLPNEELPTTPWDPFPSEMTYRKWLASTLESGWPDFMDDQGLQQTLPDFCLPEQTKDEGDCNPYKEAC